MRIIEISIASASHSWPGQLASIGTVAVSKTGWFCDQAMTWWFSQNLGLTSLVHILSWAVAPADPVKRVTASCGSTVPGRRREAHLISCHCRADAAVAASRQHCRCSSCAGAAQRSYCAAGAYLHPGSCSPCSAQCSCFAGAVYLNVGFCSLGAVQRSWCAAAGALPLGSCSCSCSACARDAALGSG